MHENRSTLVFAALVAVTMTATRSASAQQTTGTPCSPNATTTVDPRYVPPPPPDFGGEINMNAKDSKPCWPARVVPPKGAPNVLLIMTDDQGYGISSTFGGVIPTPTLDRIAKAGLRYTQFHSTSLCSPSRAALLTGRNHHSVGFGVIAEQSTGYPGYDAIIGPDNAAIGEILKENGYATSWFGKNHNTPGYHTACRDRSTSGRAEWASNTSMASWAAKPTSGGRGCSRITPRFFRGSEARLQPHHRHGGRGDQRTSRD